MVASRYPLLTLERTAATLLSYREPTSAKTDGTEGRRSGNGFMRLPRPTAYDLCRDTARAALLKAQIGSGSRRCARLWPDDAGFLVPVPWSARGQELRMLLTIAELLPVQGPSPWMTTCVTLRNWPAGRHHQNGETEGAASRSLSKASRSAGFIEALLIVQRTLRRRSAFGGLALVRKMMMYCQSPDDRASMTPLSGADLSRDCRRHPLPNEAVGDQPRSRISIQQNRPTTP